MKKRVTIIVIIGLMMLIFPLLASAGVVYNGTCGDNLTWTLDDVGNLTISGEGAMDYSSYNAPWYSYCNSISSVTLSTELTSIKDQAFSRCSNLTCVSIPDKVTYIGNNAFSYCSNLATVSIPYGVISIGNYAFSSCKKLDSITIPASVTSIGNDAFSYCSSLETITIPDSVTSIGGSAFQYCDSLTSISLPENVTGDGIGGNFAFCGCSSLLSIELPASVTRIGSYAFNGCNNLTEIVVPDSVTSIGMNAFYGCSSLSTFTFPDDVISIGEAAFSSCKSLTDIVIPEGITSLERWTFSGCTKLISITLPDEISNIGSGAIPAGTIIYADLDTVTARTLSMSEYSFRDQDMNYSWRYEFDNGEISGLKITKIDSDAKSILISDNVTGISAYGTAYYITNRYNDISKTLGQFQDPDYPGIFVHWNSDEQLEFCSVESGVTSVTIPEGVVTFGERYGSYFWGNVEEVVLPGTIKEIPLNEFMDCSTLKQVIVSRGTETIGDWAFGGCTALTGISLPDTIKNIGYCSFHGCTELAEITIPDSVINIGEYAFGDCSSLTHVTIPYGPTTLKAFSGCTNLESVSVPDSVTIIGSHAFSYCEKLKNVNIPDGVTQIDYYAFYGCNALESITIPDSVKSFGNNVFEGCSNLIIQVDHCISSAAQWAAQNGKEFTAINHRNAVRQIKTEATCTEAGIKACWECDGCGKYFSDEELKNEITDAIIAALGHQEEEDVAVAATCTTDGKTAGKHCSRCNQILIEQETIPALGHRWNAASYQWADDNSSVTAVHICDNDAAHSESETVDVTAVIISPTENRSGKATYTSGGFTKNGFSIQTKVIDIPALNKMSVIHLPYWLNEIENGAFENITSEAIIVPNACISIGSHAFRNCGNLKYIRIPVRTTISNDILEGCKNVVVDRADNPPTPTPKPTPTSTPTPTPTPTSMPTSVVIHYSETKLIWHRITIDGYKTSVQEYIGSLFYDIEEKDGDYLITFHYWGGKSDDYFGDENYTMCIVKWSIIDSNNVNIKNGRTYSPYVLLSETWGMDDCTFSFTLSPGEYWLMIDVEF